MSDEFPELPKIDVDDATSQQIARRARAHVGRGASPRRFVEPVLVGAFSLAFLTWIVLKLVEVFR